MGLLGTTTAESYYNQSQSFTGNGSAHQFVLLQTHFPTLPTAEEQFEIYINDILINPNNYSYNNSNNTITFTSTSMNTDVQTGSNGAPKNGLIVLVREVAETEQYGNYQYINVEDIINNFMVSYVGEDKIIDRVKKRCVAK